jgi:hypothetical protein
VPLGPQDSADWAEPIDDAELAAVEELVTEVLDPQQRSAVVAVLDFGLGPVAAAAAAVVVVVVGLPAWVVVAVVAGLVPGVAFVLVLPAVNLPSKIN